VSIRAAGSLVLALALLSGCEQTKPAGRAGSADTRTAPMPSRAPPPRGDLPPPQHLDPIDLSIGLKRLSAEVARTADERQHGLMGRLDLDPDRGMLFVFPDVAPRRFWMKDTPLSLAIAFIADDGKIVDISEMQAYDTTETRSRAPARYALEMRSGWFGAHGIRPGDRVAGLEKAGQARN
jgi:uncharacterized protein